SAFGVTEAVGSERVARLAGVEEETLKAWIDKIHVSPGVLAETDEEKSMDFALAALAVETGLIRHSGTIEQVFTPMGVAYQQTGKDLTRCTKLVLTGGALVRMQRAEGIAKTAMQTTQCPESLMPRTAEVVLDRHYILSAAGLLTKKYPEAAKAILGKELT
ncbi:MAG: glutamate mutase L, partial [Clostridia bacterium]|nr:glutamate mutase L [Clostridia bacterium]